MSSQKPGTSILNSRQKISDSTVVYLDKP